MRMDGSIVRGKVWERRASGIDKGCFEVNAWGGTVFKTQEKSGEISCSRNEDGIERWSEVSWENNEVF